ncbi:unnamed protein product [Effrenium voratum]|nr:unnamed protein product [Effrenium voratum]
MSDSARHSLAVQLGDQLLEPADVALWEVADDDSVPLEFLFAGANDGDQLAEVLQRVVEDRLQDERRAEFRRHLKQRPGLSAKLRAASLASEGQESALRRRKASAAEEGDAKEEKWRSYLQKPAVEANFQVHAVFDAGTRMRKVLGCRVSMSAEAARDLGKICFRHVFESDDEEKDRLQALKWYEDPFLSCFYGCSCVLTVVVVLWLCMLLPAVVRRF